MKTEINRFSMKRKQVLSGLLLAAVPLMGLHAAGLLVLSMVSSHAK